MPPRLIAWLPMSVQANSLMRTRRGLGGMKFFNVPGVYYPQEVIKPARGMNRETGLPFRKPPANTIGTPQAAAWFGISQSSVRLLLHRHKVRFYYVRGRACPRFVYWNRAQVQRLLDSQPGKSCKQPRGMLTLQQAMAELPCTRSTLQRHTAKGRVRTAVRRVATARGLRRVYYYHAGDVKKLCAYLRFCAAQRQERKAKFG